MIYRVDVLIGLDDDIKAAAAEKLGIGQRQIKSIGHIRQSVDARKGMVRINHALAVEVDNTAKVRKSAQEYSVAVWQPPQALGCFAPRPVVVGAGPCGLFAALILARAGLRPLLLERGQCTAKRAQQVQGFFAGGQHDEENNVLFGDGGAGAFSDGKLTWRGKDVRGRFVLQTMADHGAPQDILYMAKPHVGTDLMSRVITGIRAEIEKLGGEIVNGARVDGIQVRDGRLSGISFTTDGSREMQPANDCILATGHSARDTYALMQSSGISMQSKPFAVGLRIEHNQAWLDSAQYGRYAGHPKLGRAEYALTHQAAGRGVYTFCMCPGGMVLPSVSEAGCLCVNGMSYRARDMRNANAAVIVQVTPQDWGGDMLGGVQFQRKYERLAYRLACGYVAPAQRLGDFLASRNSASWGDITPSYPRGVAFARLDKLLPEPITAAMTQAISAFDDKLRGFANPDAVLTGVETRSSAPVRITRGEDMQSLSVAGLYPAGEGAGYAGGIISSAVDGIKAAEALINRLRA